ncbi:Lipopolysaccharide ABC transporter, ATP-binding protein LptB [Methylophaga frappieri]|uniref:Lipopolysaccharide export system ATP-binding protein LptB n=1 Tax=Methylophaga frappieri (strain ATCC BAA-2434 / DSM 25690 / JAM7) TaxID=754477 RepID=I1YIB3_METFJ|nr:LPS export ABC transporter ATP-binding protein [Methylophaga frappieri]AFJ02656.1 Lipopolysaccharide ABC transporter, ATP-binding protein LptB [Methylophaga frappieri]
MRKLAAQHLAKQYGSRQVVKQISLEVNSGEIVGLLGPNGAGKTTSFYMIVGLVPVDRGHIFLDQQEVTREPMHLRAQRGIGYLPQEASVFRKLTVEQNLRAIIETRQDLTADAASSLLDRLLSDFHIEPIRDALGMALSGGERRRVEIARALATEPDFILLDEPFAGVDPISVLDIQGIIKDLAARGIGILITDHNVRETLSVCQRAYIFNEGEVIARGTPAEILKNEQVLNVYLGREFRL